MSPNDLTSQILAAAFEVSNTLGAGFLEKAYKKALLNELTRRRIAATTQVPYPLKYKGDEIGVYFADIVVENRVLVELKCAEHFLPEHMAQCINYLRASGLPICLLMNFKRPKLEWKRYVHNL